MTAIREALYRQQTAEAKRLIEGGAKPDFYDACALGDWDIADLFLKTDKTLAASFADDGFQALGLAIFFGHRDLAIHLLALGAGVNEPSRNALQVTPLHSAASRGDLMMCAILLSHSADPNAKEGSGGTPLHTAAGVGDLEIVRMLVRHGADASIKTSTSDTPADYARKYKRDDIAQWLEQKLSGR